MENLNLKIYEKYRSVPQNALKPFDNGKFKGTDINTMWRIKCLTEEFGVCGVGWYYDIIRTWSEQGMNEELLCFAEIKLYVKVDGEWSKGISATGGSKLVSFNNSKKYHSNSDEGYKMAITDAFGVACKYLGFGADVYWNNDKSKYTQGDEEQGDKNTVAPKKESSPQLTPEEISQLPFNVPEQKHLTLEEAYEIEVNMKDGYKKLKDLDDNTLELVIKHTVVEEWREGARLILTFRGGQANAQG